MKTKAKEAKEYLLRIQKIETLIKNKSAEKARYMALMADRATSITANMGGEKVQTSGSKQKMAEAVESGIDYERRVDKRIAELTEERESIIETIEQLPEDKYDILHKVYVQHMSLKEVAADRGESYSSISSNHGIALLQLFAILKERKATFCKPLQNKVKHNEK